MSKYRDAILTDKGLDFVRKADNGLIKIQFTKGVMSAEDHSKDSDEAIQGLNSLNGFATSDPINYTLPIDEENVSVPLRFRNENMTENNYIDTIGIYATDGTNEILYSVIINDDPELFSAYNGKTPESVKINSTTQVGRAEQVKVQISPLGMVTEEEFQSTINNWNGDDKDHNFTAKLQHNGKDIVDIDELNSAISSFSGDNKDHNFTASLEYNGIQVATRQDVQNALVNKRGDYAEGRSFNELIGDYGVYDINNHDLANYKDNQGLPTDLGNQYGSIIPFSGTGFTIIFVFLANGRVFSAPRSQYVNAPFKELASMDQVNAKFGDAYQRAISDAEKYVDNKTANLMTFNDAIAIPVDVIHNNQHDNPSLSALTAFYNADTMTITMYGSINITNNAGVRINTANIRQHVGSYLDVANVNFADFWGFKSTTDIHIYQDNLDFYFNGPATYSLNGVQFQLKKVDSEPIQHIRIDINNDNTSAITLNNAWVDYTPNNQTATLHGSVSVIGTINAGDDAFSFDISNLEMNYVKSSFLNSQPIIIDTNYKLTSVVGKAQYSGNSGTWNLEGDTITLGYDNTLSSKIPDFLKGYNVHVLNSGDDLATFTYPSTTIYYAPAGTNVKNSPYPSSAEFIAQDTGDSNGGQNLNTVRTDSGNNGQPMCNGTTADGQFIANGNDGSWTNGSHDIGNYQNPSSGSGPNSIGLYNELFRKFGGGYPIALVGNNINVFHLPDRVAYYVPNDNVAYTANTWGQTIPLKAPYYIANVFEDHGTFAMDLNGNQASIGNLGPDDYIGSNSWVNSIWSTSQNVNEIKDILLGNKH